jgi:predicted secreted protein
MAATAGKKLRVKVATTTGGAFAVVLGVKTASMKRGSQIIDVTTLSDTELVKLMGMRDTSISFSGNWEADATGQGLIRTAYDNDTPLFAQFLPDGGTTVNAGRKVEVKVENYTEQGDKDGEVSVSFELAGTGPVTPI